jgi:hypothetical protein
MRIAAIGAFFLACLALAASDTHSAAKPANKKSSWWDTPAQPTAAAKGHGKAAVPVKVSRPQSSGSPGAPAVEPLRWPEREALSSKAAPWVIEIGK